MLDVVPALELLEHVLQRIRACPCRGPLEARAAFVRVEPLPDVAIVELGFPVEALAHLAEVGTTRMLVLIQILDHMAARHLDEKREQSRDLEDLRGVPRERLAHALRGNANELLGLGTLKR